LIIARARGFLARMVVPSALAVGVLLAATAAEQFRTPYRSVPHAVVAVSAFLCLLAGLAACLDIRLVDVQSDWLQLMALATTVGAMLVVSRTGLVGSPDTAFALIAVIAYAAWVEELVFRRILPRAFTTAFESGGVRWTPGGVVTSQLLFAACHFVPGLRHQDGLGWVSLMRLFAGGLLFAAVVSRSGLAIGALLHAELNLRAVLPQPPPDAATTIGVFLIALLGLGITVSRSPPLHILFSRGMQHEKSCSWIGRWYADTGRVWRRPV
jgi:hypothetical protein